MDIIYEGKLNQYRRYLNNVYPKDRFGNYIEDQSINIGYLDNYKFEIAASL